MKIKDLTPGLDERLLAIGLGRARRIEAIRSGLSALGVECRMQDRYEDRVSISFEEAERLIKWMRGRQ